MNKTISISISGQAFFIDEYAYEKLNRYLEEIRGYFRDSESRDEIISDIESRIAEIFATEVGKHRNVVQMEDVEKMIQIMGKPEDFSEGNESEGSASRGNREEQHTEYASPRGRRLYRNPDDKVVGGVCGGVAAYFSIDPIWLRLAFVAAVCLAGTGVLFYLVLWVVMPIAKTTAQKLEMKGEPVNISNIEKNIKEEIEEIEKRFKRYSTEAKQNMNQQYSSGFRGFIQRFSDALANLARYIAVGTLKFIGILIMIMGIALLIPVMTATFGGNTWVHLNDLNFDTMTMNDMLMRVFNNPGQLFWAKAGLFLGVGIPVVLLIYLGLRLLLNIKEKQRWVNITSLILWITGVVIIGFVINSMSKEFYKRSASRQRFNLELPQGKTLYVKSKIMYSEWDEEDIQDQSWHLDIKEDQSLRIYFPDLKIEKSETDSFFLIISRSATGEGSKEGISRAKQIQYSFTQQDSALFLDSYYEIPKGEKWRAQGVRITLKVPEGRTIFLDSSVKNLLDDIPNMTNTYDREMVNRKWLMSARGLKCMDCDGIYDESENEKNSEKAQDEGNEEKL